MLKKMESRNFCVFSVAQKSGADKRKFWKTMEKNGVKTCENCIEENIGKINANPHME